MKNNHIFKQVSGIALLIFDEILPVNRKLNIFVIPNYENNSVIKIIQIL